jgi:hypothetical protein
MVQVQRPRADRAWRPAMRSPGRPPVGRRDEQQRFWAAISRGMASEDAGIEAGVSAAVGSRWFRIGGGMRSVNVAPLSGRYLSFDEREEIAILFTRGAGVREIAWQGPRPAAWCVSRPPCDASICCQGPWRRSAFDRARGRRSA